MVETYAILNNTNDSILKLNPFLKTKGYEFIKIGLQELEEKFSDLFYLPRKYSETGKIKIGDQIISKEFYIAFNSSPLFNWETKHSGSLILLKNLEKFKFEQKAEKGILKLDLAQSIVFQTSSFCDILIRKLRLFKNGDIENVLVFHKEESQNQIYLRISKPLGKDHNYKVYQIEDNEIEDLLTHLSKEIEESPLIKLSLKNFELSYQIEDVKVKFVTLMTCLETLFNRGNDQISHIVSRHLSLIISQDEATFCVNYKKMKSLYTLRSKIVHGTQLKPKDKIVEEVELLQDLVRKAISYCHSLNKTQDELFDFLNSKGY